MKVNLAKSAGFCFGVQRAIDIALGTASSRRNVYMLGDIVHNEDVGRQVHGAGIRKIKRLCTGRGRTLVIRAHGTSAAVIARAKALGYNIVDATCPMVKEIHKVAKEMEQKGYSIIVIGDKLHDEVHGITGQLKNKALVIDSPTDPLILRLKKIKKAAVVVQSTQNIDNVRRIMEILKTRVKELRFFNTICRPTAAKQQEIRLMPLVNDVMLVIGSRTSANTRRLYEISRSLNARSYWVNSRKDIRRIWLTGAGSVGVAAGASTPDSTIKEVVKYLRSL